MSLKRFLTLLPVVAALAVPAAAQTNFQTFYDFGRGHFTTTLEGYYADAWGDTFFFVDYDYTRPDARLSVPGAVQGSYFEIARGLNFWQGTPLKDLSLHVEYNGGVGFGNQNFLFGVNYLLHNADYSNCLTFELLYKTFSGTASSNLPLQFTLVWGMQDLFGVKGLRFSGFADIWGENVPVDQGGRATWVFISEPQLWYNVGRHFGVENLHIGTEVEFSCNFALCAGWRVRPCLGTKWVF